MVYEETKRLVYRVNKFMTRDFLFKHIYSKWDYGVNDNYYKYYYQI